MPEFHANILCYRSKNAGQWVSGQTYLVYLLISESIRGG